ncbi:hypothetical protein M409DRAFT_68213 [Zasmidium cellare ATCC 36951]|uniref:DUF6536 domain-containing protein n=1 Tax=Zasmidium cellare ATCC 36951 TaxID=1080233 RepID=A0A6A6CEY9_ZASCE|nr:uncharacterized protein M409DRAFT_68213 [Zasmidium cellare ATCC 36951]KAF2163976.1 hypothetical protein M409DRAFT_68213 [Zasmidium cellare ATCC 36951]
MCRRPRTWSGRIPTKSTTTTSHSSTTRGRYLVSTYRAKRKLQGWHFGVSIAAWTASSVFLLNVIFTIVAAVQFGTSGGVGTAFDGSCEYVNHVTTWLHLVINGLSSILLSASNYTMQALSAPTRQEVDRAHSKGDWMDIGVASIRNLSRIKWHRVVAWWVLAVSSVPIHLLYNSAVFKSIDTNQYWVVVANPQWLKGGNFSMDIPWAGAPADAYNMTIPYDQSYLDGLQAMWANASQTWNATAYRNMSNAECIQTYGQNFISGFNHVLAVTNEDGDFTNETMFYAEQSSGAEFSTPNYMWLCASDYDATSSLTCDTKKIKANADEWTINGKKIDYCLSQLEPSHCRIGFSLQVLIAVIVCNALKSAAMFWTLYRQKDATLVTIGDAIASYLDQPDELTKGRCLMSRTDIKDWKLQGTKDKPNTNPLPKTYFQARAPRWFAAASWKRWITTFSLISLALIVSIVLLAMGVSNLSPVNAFSIGFGAVDSRALIETDFPQEGGGGLVAAILLANCPQAIVSFLYLLYNGLLTSMLLAKEWSQYALTRKSLRVTSPHGSQRSTYYLQLPMRYSFPLLLISATLHWIISQSIFLAIIVQYDDGVESSDGNITQVGYSCPPIVVAILIGVVLSVGAVGLGWRRFKGGMPVVGSCSVAVASACHRPKGDGDASYVPVKWGEVRDVGEGMGGEDVGHCCFTSLEVEPLVKGRMYAGEKEMNVRWRGIRSS